MPNKLNTRCIDCSCMSMPFKELSTKELIQINKNKVELSFKKGETIIKQGALAGHIVYIKRGLVKVCREHANEELVLALESRGKLLGLHALFTQNVYNYSVYASENIDVCLHDINYISKFINNNAAFGARMLNHMNDETLFAYERMTSLSLKQLHGRFADLLLCLSLRIYKRKTFNVPLSRKEMAHITNMSQESLSRILKDFTKDKTIEISGNNFKINDFEKVRHLSLVG